MRKVLILDRILSRPGQMNDHLKKMLHDRAELSYCPIESGDPLVFLVECVGFELEDFDLIVLAANLGACMDHIREMEEYIWPCVVVLCGGICDGDKGWIDSLDKREISYMNRADFLTDGVLTLLDMEDE